jgi:hypothetical protein
MSFKYVHILVERLGVTRAVVLACTSAVMTAFTLPL